MITKTLIGETVKMETVFLAELKYSFEYNLIEPTNNLAELETKLH